MSCMADWGGGAGREGREGLVKAEKAPFSEIRSGEQEAPGGSQQGGACRTSSLAHIPHPSPLRDHHQRAWARGYWGDQVLGPAPCGKAPSRDRTVEAAGV